MNDSQYQKLRETFWRRKLTAGEEAVLRSWLAAHPEAQADWEAEAGLNQALGCLPPVPVASNFTARVLQQVEREVATAPSLREPKWSWLWHPFLPKAALAAMAFCAGLLTYQRFAATQQMELAQKAQSIATVSEVALLPSPDILRDYEVIRQMNQTPGPDTALLALLK